MNGYDYIHAKQVQWALNNGIELIGSEGERGVAAYTKQLSENLFEPLSNNVHDSYVRADGGELNDNPNKPPKMHAVHSSSALAVNIFQYWMPKDRVQAIAKACDFCRSDISESLVFEEKYPVKGITNRIPPNIDVVIHNSKSTQFKCYAIECKFSESYGSWRHSGLNPTYISLNENWEDIPNIYKLAKTLSPVDNQFHHLHPAQLIKHILGLKTAFGKAGFRLLYLWYDVLGEQGTIHQEEIEIFSEIAKSDDIKFHSISVQELIIKLANEYRSDHGEYIRYMSSRYL